MSNQLYTKAKEKILSGAINFSSDTIKVALVKNTYPQDIALDEFYTAALAAYVLDTDITLTTKTITGGAFDADNVTWVAVVAGDTAEAVVIYKDTGDLATSPLIAYIDTITGFPLLTNGGDVTVQWDNGAYKIFSL